LLALAGAALQVRGDAEQQQRERVLVVQRVEALAA
jgi:hypothetical protein